MSEITDNGFVDTGDDFDWLRDDFDLAGEQRKLQSEGYSMASGDHVPNEEMHEYAFIGPLLYVRARRKGSEAGSVPEVTESANGSVIPKSGVPRSAFQAVAKIMEQS